MSAVYLAVVVASSAVAAPIHPLVLLSLSWGLRSLRKLALSTPLAHLALIRTLTWPMTTANMDYRYDEAKLKIASITVPSLAQPLVLTGPGEVHMKPSPFQYHKNTPGAEWDEIISSYADGHDAIRRRVRSMHDTYHGIYILEDVPRETEIYRKAYNAKLAAGTLPSDMPTPEEYARKLESLNGFYRIHNYSSRSKSASKTHGARALSNVHGADLD
ncbi:hypothetical protein EV359DRAFT_84984 [Lentinula novae-zelandiae]|nr:hypothetical protein EV359DRAFT_84984 [Lentinula novae-zelandiae]